MTPASTPKKMDTKQFFEELSKGRTILETTIDGRTVELTLTPPSAKASSYANFLVGRLSYRNTPSILNKMIRHACCSCIDGVNDGNVVAFLSRFPPMPRVVIESLDILGIPKKIQEIMIENNKNESKKSISENGKD